MMANHVEFPRCVGCRLTAKTGEKVFLRPDGRVEHATCPEVFCPECGCAILPDTPLRREGEDVLLHANCWIKQFRRIGRPPAAHRNDLRSPAAAGACPLWTDHPTSCGSLASSAAALVYRKRWSLKITEG